VVAGRVAGGGVSSEDSEAKAKAGKDAAKEAARAAKEAASVAKAATDAINTQIGALERAAAVWGMSADEVAIYTLEVDQATPAQLSHAKALLKTVAGFESAKKAQEDYKNLVSDLRTEEEKRTDTLREQLAILDAMQGLQPSEVADVAGRIANGATEDAPDIRRD